MKIKDELEHFAQKNVIFEKMWLRLRWMIAKIRVVIYSDYEFTKKLWKRHYGMENDFLDPKTLDEKMCFLKLSNRDPLLTLCCDKHKVREYVKQCNYEDILKTEYFCFNNADEIDFEKLPSPCYLKCNHASGMNFVFDRDKPFNEKYIRWKFNFLLKQQPYYLSREWNYKDIEPKIVCEEVLAMPDGVSDIPEIQFFCFAGKVKFLIYNLGLADENGNHKKSKRWVLWPDWTLVNEAVGYNFTDVPPTKPLNYYQMIDISEKMSIKFPLVRVDLFNIEGKIIFNEFTFYSGGGFTMSKIQLIQSLGGKSIDLKDICISKDAYKRRTRREVRLGL